MFVLFLFLTVCSHGKVIGVESTTAVFKNQAACEAALEVGYAFAEDSDLDATGFCVPQKLKKLPK